MFRIGGERGDESLVEKFQSVLGRMGIVLEFGDNTTVSFRTSPSNSPPFSLSKQQRGVEEDTSPDSHLVNGVGSSKSSSHTDDESVHNQVNGQNAGDDGDDNDDNDQVAQAIRRAALSSAMGRWRALVSRRQANQNQGRANGPNVEEEQDEDETMEAPVISRRPSIVNSERSPTRSQRSGTGTLATDDDDEISEIRPPITSTYLAPWQSTRNNEDAQVESDGDRGNGRHDMGVQVDRTRTEQMNLQEAEADDNTAKAPVQPTRQYAPGGGSSQRLEQQQFPIPTVEQQEEMMVDEPPNQETPRQRRRSVERAVKESDQQRELRRAARAREIYLASKVFNHWADRTARRLERDAVARRHMIRFRCFRGWSQTPPSQGSAVDRLKAITVVRKWKRSLHDQEQHLQAAAREAAESHRRRKVHKTLNQWCYHRLGDVAQHHHVLRQREEALSKWKSHASDLSALRDRTTTAYATRIGINFLDKWHGETEKGGVRTNAAKQIGSVQHSYAHLREWWDQAEIGRRAKIYRQQLLLKKAAAAFTHWNLQARTQAFIWKREYQAVTRVFDKWCQNVEQNNDLRQRAEGVYEERARAKVVRKLQRQQRKLAPLSRREERARLYLGATRLLKVLDVAVKHRKTQEKRDLKRYMMRRYTEVSAARKQRNFFTALDRWRSSAVHAAEQRQAAEELQARRNSQQVSLAVQAWADRAQEDQQRFADAQLLHVRDWVAAWSDYAQFIEQHEAEAWQSWAAEKQRQCVKQWSISTLQQSGQAHTASKLHNRYKRERRSRALQHWRQTSELARNSTQEPETIPALRFFPRSSYGRSWRGRSARRSTARDGDENPDYQANPFETPTRWTGVALPMSNMGTGRIMDAVDEQEEEEEVVQSPPFGGRQPDGLFDLSTTTPRAPVPTYLKRGVLASTSEPGSSTRGLRRTLPAGLSRETAPLTSELGRATTTARPVASTRRPVNTQIARLQPPSQTQSRPPVNRSVGAGPSALRYSTPQATRTTSTARSVRIQSPRSLAIRRTGRDFPSSAQ